MFLKNMTGLICYVHFNLQLSSTNDGEEEDFTPPALITAPFSDEFINKTFITAVRHPMPKGDTRTVIEEIVKDYQMEYRELNKDRREKRKQRRQQIKRISKFMKVVKIQFEMFFLDRTSERLSSH